MATISPTSVDPEEGYPDSDGKPMAETPLHRDNMFALIDLFRRRFADDPNTYVSGNMFLYYEEGNTKKNVSPDVFVALEVPNKIRRVYQTWVEGKAPDLVVELTSVSTREEDLEGKFALYRDVLQVREYFLFDPEAEYLTPPLQGYRRINGSYVPIKRVQGRLPSEVIGLHLSARGSWLGLYDPVKRRHLPAWPEALEVLESARHLANLKRRRADTARRTAEARSAIEEQARWAAEARSAIEEQARRTAEARSAIEEQARRTAEAAFLVEEQARRAAEAETDRLRRELDELRRRLEGGGA